MVEKIFRQSAEFCREDESWKLNVAHIFFMQEKFKECIRYYEPFVRKHNGDHSRQSLCCLRDDLCKRGSRGAHETRGERRGKGCRSCQTCLSPLYHQLGDRNSLLRQRQFRIRYQSHNKVAGTVRAEDWRRYVVL